MNRQVQKGHVMSAEEMSQGTISGTKVSQVAW